MQSQRINIFLSSIVGIVMLSFLAFAMPHAAHAQSSSLTDEQIDSITNLLKSFEADAEVVSEVEGTLRGTENSNTEIEDSATETVNETVETSQTQGQRNVDTDVSLPSGVSDHADEVMQCIQGGGILRKGESGAQVKDVQEFLKNQGYFDYSEATGYYGEITEEAVKEFQEAQGIVSNGSPETTGYGQIGPRTQAAITQATCLQESAENAGTSIEESVEESHQSGSVHDTSDTEAHSEASGTSEDVERSSQSGTVESDY